MYYVYSEWHLFSKYKTTSLSQVWHTILRISSIDLRSQSITVSLWIFLRVVTKQQNFKATIPWLLIASSSNWQTGDRFHSTNNYLQYPDEKWLIQRKIPPSENYHYIFRNSLELSFDQFCLNFTFLRLHKTLEVSSIWFLFSAE